MPYLLSVCIPTRNRPKALLRQVADLRKQIEAAGIGEKVEIVIADNTDQDELRVSLAQLQYPHLRYMANEGNIGYARNINKLIGHAHGKYVWLLGDDDTIGQHALALIVSSLEQQKEKPIHYLTFYIGEEWNDSRDDNAYFKDCTQHYFAEGKTFLERYWLSVIFVSANVFHREKMISHAREHDLFWNINDVYQSGLLCISFIDAFGGVGVIPETLVWDSRRPKLYTPANSVKAPVADYVKLYLQLKSLGMSQEVLQKIQGDVERSLLSNGLRFIVRKLEAGDTFDYAGEYGKLLSLRELPLSLRAKAHLIRLLFWCHPVLAKAFLKLLYTAGGRAGRYELIRRESVDWYKHLKNNSIRISYGQHD